MKKETIKILKNYFSREKKLYYFDFWNQCDQDGMKKYFSAEIKNSLFIVPVEGEKGSVWYVEKEMDFLKKLVANSSKDPSNNDVWNRIENDAWKSWEYLKPYAVGEKDIENICECKKYQEKFLLFWTALNSVLWEAIDEQNFNSVIHEAILSVRAEFERFSEKISDLVPAYFEKTFPDYQDIFHVLTFKEMITIAEKKLSLEELEKIRKRKIGCFLFNGIVYSGLENLDFVLEKNNLKLEEDEIEEVAELSGVVAMKGYSKGIVRKIKTRKEILDFKEGEILVTQMTSPDYIPAIKKASAIVTNEGGSLCHAAIISRELKKPCVIGTKIATQVLKDGDLVEVDAEKGVVRIIKKAEK